MSTRSTGAKPMAEVPAPKGGPPDLGSFVRLSAALSGYDAASLWATGCVGIYRRQLAAVAGPALLRRLLEEGDAVAEVSGGPDCPAGAALMRRSILADPDLGPLARSLIQLWYLGQWTPMPPDWVTRNGFHDEDSARILSVRAYREGLVWNAIGAHPMGAKPQGFGAWATEPPRLSAGALEDEI